MSRHRRHPNRQRHLARLLSKATTRLHLTRQAGQAHHPPTHRTPQPTRAAGQAKPKPEAVPTGEPTGEPAARSTPKPAAEPVPGRPTAPGAGRPAPTAGQTAERVAGQSAEPADERAAEPVGELAVRPVGELVAALDGEPAGGLAAGPVGELIARAVGERAADQAGELLGEPAAGQVDELVAGSVGEWVAGLAGERVGGPSVAEIALGRVGESVVTLAGSSRPDVASGDPATRSARREAAPSDGAVPLLCERHAQPALVPSADGRPVQAGGPKRTRRATACGGRLSCDECDERSGDRGAATLWVVGGLAVLLVVMTGVLWFGAAVVARHQAEGAADLAALAAAAVAVDGERLACAEARWVVEQMDGALRSCRLSGWDALVEVDVAFGPFGSAAGRARAGPVEVGG